MIEPAEPHTASAIAGASLAVLIACSLLLMFAEIATLPTAILIGSGTGFLLSLLALAVFGFVASRRSGVGFFRSLGKSVGAFARLVFEFLP